MTSARRGELRKRLRTRPMRLSIREGSEYRAWAMANRLSSAQRSALWEAFQGCQTIEHVSRKCGVHHATAQRYRVLDRWDERLIEVRRLAQKRADYSRAEAMAESLILVREYKERLATALASKKVSSADVTAAELERVIRLEAFVLGGAESRHEVVTEFGKWSDEELEAFARDGTSPRESRSRTA